ncbi:MAG: RsmD family RNA methyltransferase [Verrucomicrobiota bacterium]
MRITGGILGRREIRVPKGIRPTQDKVRAAIFSSLAAEVPGARDAAAKRTAADVCRSFGRGVVDVGGIESARLLKPFAMLWITYALGQHTQPRLQAAAEIGPLRPFPRR